MVGVVSDVQLAGSALIARRTSCTTQLLRCVVRTVESVGSDAVPMDSIPTRNGHSPYLASPEVSRGSPVEKETLYQELLVTLAERGVPTPAQPSSLILRRAAASPERAASRASSARLLLRTSWPVTPW